MSNKLLNKIQFEEHKDRLIISISDKFSVPREEVGAFFDEKLSQEGELDDKGRYDALFKLKGSALLKFSKPQYEKNFDVVVIGETRVTDFGKGKKYEEALTVFRTNPQKAINDGYTNEKGQPIEKVPYDRTKKRVIDADDLMCKTLFGVVRINNETKPIQINLKGEASKLNIPLFQKIKISGSQGKDSEDGWVSVYSTKNTKVNIVSNELEDINKYLKFFNKELSLSIEDIESPKEVMGKKVQFFIQKSTISIDALKTMYKITFVPHMEEKVNNDLDTISNLDDVRTYVGFIDEKPDYVESGVGYIIGRSFYKNKDGTTGFEIYGIYITEPYLL